MTDQFNQAYIEKLAYKAARNRRSFLARRKLKKIHKQLLGLKKNKYLVADAQEAEFFRSVVFKAASRALAEAKKDPKKLAKAQKRFSKLSSRIIKHTMKSTAVQAADPLDILTKDVEKVLKYSAHNPQLEEFMGKWIDKTFRFYKRSAIHRNPANLVEVDGQFVRQGNPHYMRPALEKLSKLMAERASDQTLQTYANLVAKRFYDRGSRQYYGFFTTQKDINNLIPDPKNQKRLQNAFKAGIQNHRENSLIKRGKRFVSSAKSFVDGKFDGLGIGNHLL